VLHGRQDVEHFMNFAQLNTQTGHLCLAS
jgi:hypothetical protein